MTMRIDTKYGRKQKCFTQKSKNTHSNINFSLKTAENKNIQPGRGREKCSDAPMWTGASKYSTGSKVNDRKQGVGGVVC